MDGVLSREEAHVLRNRTIRTLLDDRRLTPWERSFLENIANLKNLSERQTFIMDRIRRQYARTRA